MIRSVRESQNKSPLYKFAVDYPVWRRRLIMIDAGYLSYGACERQLAVAQKCEGASRSR